MTEILINYTDFYAMSQNLPKYINLITQIKTVALGTISIILLGSYFISIVFTMQVMKEFVHFNASSIIGGTLANIYIRELSPVITAVILTGKVASAFTAEIAIMKVTKQLDAMCVMNTSPISYLIIPRVLACCIVLPLLNILSFLASLSNSMLISALFYNISVVVFRESICWSTILIDGYKSLAKSVIFAVIMSIISCYFGLTAINDTKGVGLTITSSVVIILMLIFTVNFILSYLIFY
uniref:ABC transporter permease n=1 Tax=Apophlaea sinclairii TaxID=212746 RepID=A0A1C9CBQ8_9FLOR|nr:hypothetical protein Apop_094 [Apophlaea sinclairii]AOM65784.1 hypothetical protein Apop_094 [Apophlaea sinclairii]